MPSVYNRGTRSKPNYWVAWVDRNGERHAEKVGPDRVLAKQVAAKLEVARHDKTAKRFGIDTDAPPEIPTFREAAEKFIERRKAVGKDGLPMKRSWKDDKQRCETHLFPKLGDKLLDEITEEDVRELIGELRPLLQPQTIRNCFAIGSRLYNEQPKSLHLVNPFAQLDRADRDSIGPGWDPKKTPFLRSDSEVRSVHLGIPELVHGVPWRAMFGVGVFAGLRPGEIRALEWADVDFDAGLLHIRRSVGGPLKDDDSRMAPLSSTLRGVLLEWKAKTKSASELCFPSTGHRGRFVKEQRLGRELRRALTSAGLPRMTWYQCTRHTYGARFVTNGGSLMKLANILGHSTTVVTMRSAHLVPGSFTEAERHLVDVQLHDVPGVVSPLRPAREVRT